MPEPEPSQRFSPELTIRTAILIRCAAQLIGVTDPRLAKAHMAQIVGELMELRTFLDVQIATIEGSG